MDLEYRSERTVESRVMPGVTFRLRRVSFGRRLELMRRIREIALRVEFKEAGGDPGDEMGAALLRAEIDRLQVVWGIRAMRGLAMDRVEATPEMLAETGPEDLFQEALQLVRAEMGLSGDERKN